MKTRLFSHVLFFLFATEISFIVNAQTCPPGTGTLTYYTNFPDNGQTWKSTLSTGETVTYCKCVYNTSSDWRAVGIRLRWIEKPNQEKAIGSENMCKAFPNKDYEKYEVTHPEKAIMADFHGTSAADIESAKIIARQLIAQVEAKAAWCRDAVQ
ncbi:MAG: hypothetical protein ACRDEB_06995, partial [Chitinophagaceae bacterium]